MFFHLADGVSRTHETSLHHNIKPGIIDIVATFDGHQGAGKFNMVLNIHCTGIKTGSDELLRSNMADT
jgi:hypothetical protein